MHTGVGWILLLLVFPSVDGFSTPGVRVSRAFSLRSHPLTSRVDNSGSSLQYKCLGSLDADSRASCGRRKHLELSSLARDKTTPPSDASLSLDPKAPLSAKAFDAGAMGGSVGLVQHSTLFYLQYTNQEVQHHKKRLQEAELRNLESMLEPPSLLSKMHVALGGCLEFFCRGILQAMAWMWGVLFGTQRMVRQEVRASASVVPERSGVYK
uniref:Transmembrane protein n=1 Tax=Hemiselmis andersenii TaxID=464988 RepID=A0A6U2E156_HEMAN|mmetsp:Transcript_25382/g.58820  ORF Transcript_25382/g.58820 Transcript_25382/m.58820 type:complete len:210 (-) Transcript_25382:174-803(-)